MASKVQIVNKGLQKIGAARIGSFEENSNSANAVREVYDILRRSELEANYWRFAIKRVSISSDSTAPAFGRTYRFLKPADYLRRAPDDPSFQTSFDEILDEGEYLLSNNDSTLDLRYVADITDEAKFAPSFADGLSMRIAMELAEALTQSNSKLDKAESAYTFFIDRAKKINAIESGPIAREIDEFVSVRSSQINDRSLRPFTD
jgi:hypothetical protein